MNSSTTFVPTSVLLEVIRSAKAKDSSDRDEEMKTSTFPTTELTVQLPTSSRKAYQQDEKTTKPSPSCSVLSSACLRNSQAPKKILKSSKQEQNSIVLAVDATPDRGGGLLRLSGSQDRKIFYYSVSWTSLFDFQGEPQKFEMANALIALNLFTPRILEYLKDEEGSYNHVIFKTDNNFFLVHRGYDDPFDLQFFKTVLKKASSIKATFKQALISQGDVDMINCDHLSRDGSASHQLKMEYDANNHQSRPYSVEDLSQIVEETILYEIREELPAKYVLGFSNKYD